MSLLHPLKGKALDAYAWSNEPLRIQSSIKSLHKKTLLSFIKVLSNGNSLCESELLSHASKRLAYSTCLKTNDDKLNQEIVDSMSTFISTNLNANCSNAFIDAKHSIARASLGDQSKSSNELEKIREKLGFYKQFFSRFKSPDSYARPF